MTWFYDPALGYEENYARGPFGAFAEPPVDHGTDSDAIAETFLGRPVRSAFGIPAGPLLNSRFCTAAFTHGFDVNVYKTVRSCGWPAHAWPNSLAVRAPGDLPAGVPMPTVTADEDWSTARSITNSFGVPSRPSESWQPDMAAAVAAAGPGQMLIGSFQGTRPATDASDAAYLDDWARTAVLVASTGVAALEMNLSCPNEGTGSLLCFDTDLTRRAVTAVRESVPHVPILLKLAYFSSDDAVADMVRATAPWADGYAAVNSLPARVVNRGGAPALPGREAAGVCGESMAWAAVAMVERLARVRAQLGIDRHIVGVGGVSTLADVTRLRDVGADAVMAATGALRDPTLGVQVRRLPLATA